jgi:hypothetical protein
VSAAPHVLAYDARRAPSLSGAAEFLRVVAALRAVGCDATLVSAAGDAPDADGPDADEARRLLDTLAADGLVRRGQDGLAAALAACDALLVLGDPGRSGTPPVLRLSRGEAPSERELRALPEAGQVVLA